MTSTNTTVHISNSNTYSSSNPRTALFDFNSHRIRTDLDAKGNPWFVAVDVCTALGIKNSRQALTKLDDDEKDVISSDTLGGIQTFTIVSESGLYELIFRSRKAEAKEFKRWVKQVVLPTLSKDGSYTLGEERLFSDCKTEDEINARMVEAATQLNQMRDAKLERLKDERRREHKEEKEARSDALRGLNRGRSRRSSRPTASLKRLP